MKIQRVASFCVNHNKLLRGVYLSRLDYFQGVPISSFDIRMHEPNREPVMDISAIHALEHLGATFFRNHDIWNSRIVYFGPMGCRTGYYLVIEGNLKSSEIVPLLQEFFIFVLEFREKIPGQSSEECGNYLDMNLSMAQWESKRFCDQILSKITQENLEYPEAP